MSEVREYDVVIVGAGPGGLCAGMYSARANRKTVCLEKYLPGGQIANTHEVEDYLGFDRISGAELSMKFADLIKVIIGTHDKRLSKEWRNLLLSKGINVVFINGANHFFDKAHEFDLADSVESLLEAAN